MHPSPSATPTCRTRQRGLSMLESLIAVAVLALGMIGLARVHVDLRGGAEAARERSEAMRLAQQDIEQLRAFATPALCTAMADTEPQDVTPPGATVQYLRERSVQTQAGPYLRSVQVMLRWADRHGAPQALRLHTLIGCSDPALSGALALPRPDL
jgi:prepilin-type N-terminal cleavage/methylation domain-containing protein